MIHEIGIRILQKKKNEKKMKNHFPVEFIANMISDCEVRHQKF